MCVKFTISHPKTALNERFAHFLKSSDFDFCKNRLLKNAAKNDIIYVSSSESVSPDCGFTLFFDAIKHFGYLRTEDCVSNYVY